VIGADYNTYLDDAKAENRGCHIANEHTGERSNKHVGDEHRSWSGARLAQDERSDALIDLTLGQGGSDSEPTQE
jgi:hypothetical protein